MHSSLNCWEIYESLTYFVFLIYRVFLALSEDSKDRGIIVAQGGGKVSDQFGNQCCMNLQHDTKSFHCIPQLNTQQKSLKQEFTFPLLLLPRQTGSFILSTLMFSHCLLNQTVALPSGFNTTCSGGDSCRKGEGMSRPRQDCSYFQPRNRLPRGEGKARCFCFWRGNGNLLSHPDSSQPPFTWTRFLCLYICWKMQNFLSVSDCWDLLFELIFSCCFVDRCMRWCDL